MSPKDADRMVNTVDPDQEQSDRGAVWSGSTLFAQAYLSENLGSIYGMMCSLSLRCFPFIIYKIWFIFMRYDLYIQDMMYIQDLQRPAEWIMTKYMADMAKLYKTGQDLQVISKSNVNPKA